jgi:hypothetical protein
MTTTTDREAVTLAAWKAKHKDYRGGDAGYGNATMLQWVEGTGTCLVPVEIEGVEDLTRGMRHALDDDERRAVANAILKQIGMDNWMAISGRRVEVRDSGVTLPVASGYAVAIDLAGNDTYTVRRVRKINGITRVASGHGTGSGALEGVYDEQLGELAYQASCYKNVPFGAR